MQDTIRMIQDTVKVIVVSKDGLGVWGAGLTFLVTVLTGVSVVTLGQIIQRFLIEPYQEFKKTVGEIGYALVFYANVYNNVPVYDEKRPPPQKDEYLETAGQETRRLAVKLRTSMETINAYSIFLRLKLVPPKKGVLEASSNLIGLSNGLYLQPCEGSNKAYIRDIVQSLRLPTSEKSKAPK